MRELLFDRSWLSALYSASSDFSPGLDRYSVVHRAWAACIRSDSRETSEPMHDRAEAEFIGEKLSRADRIEAPR
mgnify:CR=1 FL=1